MALIPKEVRTEKTNIRIRINSEVAEQVNAYCQWAGIEEVSHFFMEAAKIVLLQDKKWRKARQINDPESGIG